MVRQENIEAVLTVTSIIPASTVNSENNSTAIITQNNQPEPIPSELINLGISNTHQKAKNLANRASYNPSSSSQKVYRRDYSQSQSVAEGQGSVHEFLTEKLCHPEADNTVLTSNRSETTTKSLNGDIKKPSRRLTTMHCSTKGTRYLQICGKTA
ncbi:hypothetical protein O181_029470 [Austropuccinia psidii MF-1]|uniref:Uncharacterized protein n=1 Tax=Austropuccinia psidii MF-1 TaxID=1389203 RepID=A0A9Q3CV99_9BASI|nr:hypothetical protein [Austropuccinia psidii MF-1]